MKILIASPIFEEAIERLREKNDVVLAFNAGTDELKKRISDRDALVFRSGVDINADVMARAPGLRLLVRAGSGCDNVDLDYVQKNGLEIIRIPGPGARAVAELGFSLMLALARQIVVADKLLRSGRWAKHELSGYLLAGKTLAIYGAGNIGSLLGCLGHAWDMDVIGCVKNPSAERAAELLKHGVRLAGADEVLATGDFLSINLPLTDETRNLIDKQAISRMKPGSFLVNLARGGIVDEHALLEALTGGRLAGAGLDVHASEGEGKISPLVGLSNVILTPHIGAMTVDSQRAIGDRIIEIVAQRS
ncbi:MAG: hydroxyacid dehydrogenase [Gammaproteobacteria bacterium]|nr:hydroxyacid dehydrogenase [Gammaproteobacteria bacterium]